MLMLIVGGLAGQEDELSSELTAGADEIQSWAEDAGIGQGQRRVAPTRTPASRSATESARC